MANQQSDDMERMVTRPGGGLFAVIVRSFNIEMCANWTNTSIKLAHGGVICKRGARTFPNSDLRPLIVPLQMRFAPVPPLQLTPAAGRCALSDNRDLGD